MNAEAETKVIEPGIYFDLPDDDYFALPYASKSGLWRVHTMPDTIRTVEQAQAWLLFGKPSYAMRLGRAFDDCMSKGESWREEWIETPVNEKTGKGYGGDTKKVQEFLDENGENCIAPEDFELVEKWRDAVYDHPDAAILLSEPRAKHQATVVWDDERTGQRCKGKIDLLTVREGVTVHVDYKTWTKKRPGVDTAVAFGWESEDRGYAVQAAHYLDGCEALDKLAGRRPRHREFSIVAVSKQPVVIEATGEELFEVEVLDFRQNDIEGALRIRDALLEKWIEIVNGTWKPARRGRRELVMSGRVEQSYGDRPE